MNLKPFIFNWKTTLSGIVAAVGTVLLGSEDENWRHVGQIVMAAGALLLGVTARDANKTSEQSGATKSIPTKTILK